MIGRYVTIGLFVSGGICLIVGLFSIPPAAFSWDAAIEVILGSLLVLAGFIVHANRDFTGTRLEIAYIALVSLSILLFASAIVSIMVVNVQYNTVRAVIPSPGRRTSPGEAIIQTVSYTYQGMSFLLFGAAVILLAIGYYVKTKIGITQPGSWSVSSDSLPPEDDHDREKMAEAQR